MKKRILATLTVLYLALSLLTVGVSAASIVDSGECGDNVTWTLDSEGLLTISGTGAMESHEGPGWYPWFDNYHTKVQSLEIENGVTSIGDYAFANYFLKQIKIAESVTVIGTGAFEASCPESLYIPGTVSDIGKLTFNTSARLEHVTIGNGLPAIPDEAFRACWSLSDITIPASVTKIGKGAFMGCNELADVYYGGTQAQWNAIEFIEDDNVLHNNPHDWYNNDPLFAAAIHYNDSAPVEPLSASSATGDTASKFIDVKESDVFFDAVQWAVENDITNGTGEMTFSPNMTVTRAQAMTFLWRLAGKPEPKFANNLFTDVKASDWYYKPVLWAIENGITNGTSENTFSPNMTCSHAHMAAFMQRTAQEEYMFEGIGNVWYSNALKWVQHQGFDAEFGYLFDSNISESITSEMDCTRANTVAYLYAFNAMYGDWIPMLYSGE